MKVLILHQHFNMPEQGGAIRSYYLAKALVEAGHKVQVVTAHNEKAQLIKLFEGIEIFYLPISYDNKYGFIARSWAFIKFVLGVIRISNHFKDADCCYAISVPLTVGIAARWLKSVNKIPYYFEVGDLWPDAPVQMGFVKNYFFAHLLFHLEKSIYKRAKSIVALSPAIKQAIEKKVPGKKVHLLTNMSDCEFFQQEDRNTVLEDKYNLKGKFVISYIGAIGLANGLDYFLECANLAHKHQLPIHFFICGKGALLNRLKESAKSLDLKNLTFVDFTDRDGVKELLNITDASFISYKPLPILETGSPNKFFDGLAAGKLIIVNFGGWIKEEIELNSCGISLDHKDPTGFISKIAPFLSDANRLLMFQNASRALAEKKYSRKLLSQKFIEIINEK